MCQIIKTKAVLLFILINNLCIAEKSVNPISSDSIKKINYEISISQVIAPLHYFFTSPSFLVVSKKSTFSLGLMYHQKIFNAKYSYGVDFSYQYCRKPQRKICNWFWAYDLVYINMKEKYQSDFTSLPSANTTFNSTDKYLDQYLSFGLKIKLLKQRFYIWGSEGVGMYYEIYKAKTTYANTDFYDVHKSRGDIYGLIKFGIGYRF